MIFLDSSILVEYSKGNGRDFMTSLLGCGVQLHYNSIVLTEYLYHFLGYQGGKAPRTLKENQRIGHVLNADDPLRLLNLFGQLVDAHPPAATVVRLMKTYNMLPNDAIILAHCLTTGIRYVASYDVTDFATPCRREGITLLDSVEALKHHVPVP